MNTIRSFRSRLAVAAVTCMLAATALSQSNKPLTNGIPLLPGVHLAIADRPFAGPPGSELKDTEVLADRPLTWIVYTTTSNSIGGVHFLGMSNSFALELKTVDGHPISKSAKGEGMSAGPRSQTNFRANRNIRMREVGYMDFPSISELFKIQSNGVYIAEIRYWTWIYPQGKFILSDPIRLKVIKQDTNSPPGSAKSPEPK